MAQSCSGHPWVAEKSQIPGCETCMGLSVFVCFGNCGLRAGCVSVRSV